MRWIWICGLLAAGCAGSEPADDDTDTPIDLELPYEEITLDSCTEDIAADTPAFYQTWFACSEISNFDDGVLIASDGLPPHPSPYYPDDHPNWVAFDDRGGTHHQNPGEIDIRSVAITIPANPVPKGITIDEGLIDNAMGTSDEEYSGGAIGVALDGVQIFAAMAAPGDELAEEQYTFDLYEGHPAGSDYHYHFNTPGPLEVLVDKGFSSTSTPREGEVELYGILCDGTLVLGCTELDGTRVDSTAFDAQNGHVHDIGDGAVTYFTERYHTHVCPDLFPDYIFFPEIAYYEEDACPSGPR